MNYVENLLEGVGGLVFGGSVFGNRYVSGRSSVHRYCHRMNSASVMKSMLKRIVTLVCPQQASHISMGFGNPLGVYVFYRLTSFDVYIIIVPAQNT